MTEQELGQVKKLATWVNSRADVPKVPEYIEQIAIEAVFNLAASLIPDAYRGTVLTLIVRAVEGDPVAANALMSAVEHADAKVAG